MRRNGNRQAWSTATSRKCSPMVATVRAGTRRVTTGLLCRGRHPRPVDLGRSGQWDRDRQDFVPPGAQRRQRDRKRNRHALADRTGLLTDRTSWSTRLDPSGNQNDRSTAPDAPRQSLPSTVPFVGPEAQERMRGKPFAARLGANESGFGPAKSVIKAMSNAASKRGNTVTRKPSNSGRRSQITPGRPSRTSWSEKE